MFEQQYSSNKAIFATCLLSAAGALVFNAFPQVLTAIAIQFELGEAEVGSLISAYMGAFALLALFAPLWMKALLWKPTAMVAYVVLGTGVVMLQQGGKDLIGTAMFIMGLGASVLFTISVGVISAARDPDSGFGLKLTAEMALGAVLIFVVAKLVVEQFGYNGFIYGTLILYALTAPAILWLPNKVEFAKNGTSGEVVVTGFNWKALLSAVALFVFFGAYTAVWSFAGHIGIQQGLHEAQISTVLTFALLTGLAGALFCAWLGLRQGHLKPLLFGMALMAMCFIALIYSEGMLFFAIAVCLINGLLQFVAAYQMGLLAMVDHSGRYTSLIAFILA
ncbi:MAG: MFS transporter [Amphritea sp.]